MAATEHIEIERKYDVGETFVLPDLGTVAGVAGVGTQVEHHLEAAYHDTADLRLARARITLRRRTGGDDAGWHLKLPAVAGARRELHQPLGRALKAPPRAVLAPVQGIVRRAPAGAVATLSTRRLVTPLLAEDGRVLAEVADDQVTGTALPAGPGEAAVVTTWREVEVELVDGEEELLAAVAEVLTAAGAVPSDSPSKLTRALGDRLADADRSPVEGTDTAGGVLVAALRSQLAALQRADLMVRTDQPDGVHQVRVASRRLRSVLAAFRRLLDREQTDLVRDELQWLGGELSGTRDAEVSLEHLRALVAGQPVELVLGPVAARLQQAELSGVAAGSEQAGRVLSTPRYLQLLDTLAGLADDPPLTGPAGDPAMPVLVAVLTHTVGRLQRQVTAASEAGASGDAAAHDLALHEVRKAAKRVRYTAEVAAPVLGGSAMGLVDAVKQVQDVLGDRQDTVVTREQCRQFGLAAFAAGENAWTYGRLHALEEARAAAAETAFWALWPSLAPVLRLATTPPAAEPSGPTGRKAAKKAAKARKKERKAAEAREKARGKAAKGRGRRA